MTTDELLQLFTGEKAYRQLAAEIRPGRSVGLASLTGSSLSLVAAAAVRQTGGLHVFVMEDRDAKKYVSSEEEQEDLISIGTIGLMKAVDHFDPGRMVKFSTYAVPMIIGEIRRYLRDNSPIRVSRSLRDTAYKAIYAKEGYIKRHMKEPTVQEIAEEIGIAKEEIVYALDAIQMP